MKVMLLWLLLLMLLSLQMRRTLVNVQLGVGW